MVQKINHKKNILKMNKEAKMAKKRARIALKKAKENVIKAGKKVNVYIKDNPKKAALIAAGVLAATIAGVAATMKKRR